MLKVNLEKKMLSGKKTNLQESLILKEFENIIQNDNKIDLSILKKLSLNSSILEAEEIKEKNLSLAKYDTKRIFHISEIKKIAGKYRLRFLDPSLYKGTIDPLVPRKVKEFEEQYYNVNSNFQLEFNDLRYEKEYNPRLKYFDYKILAPESSFNLQERPKDPLMFAQISEEYYYLIHKWGDDLSVWNWFKAGFSLYNILPLVVLIVFISGFCFEDVVGTAGKINYYRIYILILLFLVSQPLIFVINKQLNREKFESEIK